MERKKTILGLIFGLILAVGVTWSVVQRNQYQICSQLTLGSGSDRQTTVNVIVSSLFANEEKIVDEIISEHRRVNYENSSERLILRLYHSKWELLRGLYFNEVIINDTE